jgi:hypothetical protein
MNCGGRHCVGVCTRLGGIAVSTGAILVLRQNTIKGCIASKIVFFLVYPGFKKSQAHTPPHPTPSIFFYQPKVWKTHTHTPKNFLWEFFARLKTSQFLFFSPPPTKKNRTPQKNSSVCTLCRGVSTVICDSARIVLQSQKVFSRRTTFNIHSTQK